MSKVLAIRHQLVIQSEMTLPRLPRLGRSCADPIDVSKPLGSKWVIWAPGPPPYRRPPACHELESKSQTQDSDPDSGVCDRGFWAEKSNSTYLSMSFLKLTP